MSCLRFVFALLCLFAIEAKASAQAVLKIATLAPEGSSWMVMFHDWARNIEQHSQGKLKIKFYAGGVAGDERDMVRKMKLGQMDGAAVTSIGLGLIQSEVRVLELPLMINSYAELDYVRGHLDAEIRKKFEANGYELLNWGDVGPVHIFSNIAINSRADLAKTKMWTWTDDSLVRALFQQLGISGVPLGVPDVLPNLQTGLINACYGSPLSTLALQWYTKVSHITQLHITQAIGATVLTNKAFERIGPDLQKIVLADSKALEQTLLTTLRADNVKALATMKQNGLIIDPTPPALLADLTQAAAAIRTKLEPSVYSHEFRMQVEKLLADYRAAHPKQ